MVARAFHKLKNIYIYIYIKMNFYIYIPDCKISLASFVLYFHLLLIRSFIRIRSFSFVSWSLLQKLNFHKLLEIS